MSVETYKGSCQCGAVSYEVDADLDKTVSCNCSRCRRLGSILTFVSPASFRMNSGEGAMTEYQFNRHMIHHMFCSTCGIQSFAHGKGPGGAEMIAVNARCLEGVDPDKLHPKKVDGASF
ncbi:MULTISPECIES: GFA family protein [Mesorhizobium]|uniref:GFA family protein n=1 Tax=Mesorhizobium denitrificans TaxID=2294114 RepID=A0A371XJY1_9HYPH|nr:MULTISPECIES: GFA family protein [Mesorhizobium]RFC69521.1 GFA family protein [Mesorhizobium denitrificans]